MALKFVQGVRSMGALQRLLRPGNFSQHVGAAASFHTTRFRFNEHIINIQDEDDFKDRVIGNKTPVIVDFHAGWCGPCKLLGPRLEALVGAHNGDVILAKVDIDDMPDLAMDHGVEAVPTVLSMRNGKIEDKFVGLKEDDQLDSFIRKLTGK